MGLAAEHLMDSGKSIIFNLGCETGYSVKEMIELASKVAGRPIKAIEAPRRAGDPARLVASSEKIRAELGWRPRFGDPEAILRTAWNWHRNHPNGYRG